MPASLTLLGAVGGRGARLFTGAPLKTALTLALRSERQSAQMSKKFKRVR